MKAFLFYCLVILVMMEVALVFHCAPVGKFIINAANSDPEGRRYVIVDSSGPVELLPGVVNSAAGESNPAISPDGRFLYFGRSKGGNFFDYKIFVSEKTAKGWSGAKRLGSPPNMNDQNYMGSFTAGGQVFVFTSHNSGGFNKDNESKIMIAEKKGAVYEIIEELDFFADKKGLGFNPLNKKWNLKGQTLYQSPFLSADGTRLLFASNVEGGYGAYDLYVSVKDAQGKWGIPENLGPKINTSAMETCPYLYPDHSTLFFSSNGHPGIGKLDIYRSELNQGEWSPPELLGPPINSRGTDSYFSMDVIGETAYFVSDRAKQNDYNIYQTAVGPDLVPSKAALLTGKIQEIGGGKPLSARVMMEDLEKGAKMAELSSDFETGRYAVPIIKGKSYSISAEKEGYAFYSMVFTLPEDYGEDTLYRDVFLAPIKDGASFPLNNLFFDTGSAKIKEESKLELERLVELLRSYPDYEMEIAGHTDNVGGKKRNQVLSKERAESVKAFLIESGISASLLKTEGYGFSKPIASNETEEGRRKNRRVEIVFMKKK